MMCPPPSQILYRSVSVTQRVDLSTLTVQISRPLILQTDLRSYCDCVSELSEQKVKVSTQFLFVFVMVGLLTAVGLVMRS